MISFHLPLLKAGRKSSPLLLALLVLCPLLAAAFVSAHFGWNASLPKTGPASLLLMNGVIYTGDPVQPRAQAVAIRGEQIVAVGSTAEMRHLAGPGTRTLELQGRFAMPGFNDAHVHLGEAGQLKLSIDLGGARSLAEFQQRIRARLGEYKPGEWIIGRGWDHTLWSEKRFPTRQELDLVSREHPMIFTRVDGHVAVANSLALQRAGITRDTK